MTPIITSEEIEISDEYGRIVYWVADEWRENPEVTLAIVNAIDLYYREGPAALRKLMDREILPLRKEEVVPWRVRQMADHIQALKNQGMDTSDGLLRESCALLRRLADIVESQ
jgi:hypothetical protein